ncbi:hypothetical protein B0I35DRAFT_494669 [Stachybotrys elegans]|uniref:GLEYA adhesin domain-containing protein n=1 Tax=Stachybotrys elegans TaxID=80388 RepID=A0A8K0SAF3_9HYPO|nr:hypothetical protein B0I35DRAFT_494669 [Stachybotrys elegans]
MKYALTGALLAGLAAAGPCNNNCGRAVFGTARASPALAERSALCAEFVKTTSTVTLPAVTETAVLYNRNVHARADAVITGHVPAYASACANVEAYWNACQCFSDVKATTTTVTAPAPVETLSATCAQGIEYGIYGVDGDSRRSNLAGAANGLGHGSVDLHLQFSGRTPDVSGVSPTIGTILQFTDPDNVPVSLYGTHGPAGSTMGFGVVNHRGYLIPSKIGDYTIYLDTSDNAFYAWVGESAISSWSFSNAAISRFWPPVEGESYSHVISVTEDTINIPVALRFVWMNYGGPGALSARIVDPEGVVILGEDSTKNHQIVAHCSGAASPVPQWAEWANELLQES